MNIDFQAKQLELSQLVEWLAAVIYPDDEPREAKKLVRERIRYGAEKKKAIRIFIKNNKKYVDTVKFFSWAFTKWPELIDVEGIPKETITGTGAMSLPSLEGEAFGVNNIPNDIGELRKAYVKAESERHRIQLENDKLHNIIAELEDEVHMWREKDAERRRKCGHRITIDTK